MKRKLDDVESNDVSTAERIVLISKSGGRHQIDRNMLLQASNYFQGLVNSGMRDAHCKELTLECVTNESLIEVSYYLSELSTDIIESRDSRLKSLNEVEAGLDAAFYLQINEMIDSYNEMLLEHLNKKTCIRILDIANKHVLSDRVVKRVIEYMLKNFKEISENSKLLLSPDELFRLVASDKINADSEGDILNLVIKWISEDQSRKCLAEKLLAEVRYSLMTPTEKQKYTAILHDLNLNINYDTDKNSNHSRTVGMLFAVGTEDRDFFNILPVYDFVEACKLDGIELNSSDRRAPPADLYDYKACVVDNCLYLVGALQRHSFFCSEVFMYNPVHDVWSKCCNMHLERTYFYLGGLAGHLYAVSGKTTKFIGTPTVEKYIPSEDRWYMVESLPLALPKLAGCVCNGMIYVSGGRDVIDEPRNLVYQYDPFSKKWFSRAPMLTARFSHVMTCVGSKIFVIGGKHKPGRYEVFDVMDGEMYDVESDQWSSVLKLKLPVSGSPSITINNCFYIFEHNTIVGIPKFQKINLAKYLKEKKTSNDSSLSSEQDRNANNNNLVTNEAKKQNFPCVDDHTDDDCQVFTYKPRNGKLRFYCKYFGVMIISDV